MARFCIPILALTVAAQLGPVLQADAPALDMPTSYERHVVHLPKSLPMDNHLELHLGVQDGQIRQAWGEIPGNLRAVDYLDTSRLKLADGKLNGELEFWVKLDSRPQTYICLMDIQADLADGKLTGSFANRISVLTETLVYKTDKLIVEPGEFSLFHYGQELTGDVTCRMLAAPSKSKAHITIWTRHLLEGHASWTRYVTLKIDVSNGQAATVEVSPTNGPRAGWAAKDLKHDLKFDGRDLKGTVTFRTDDNGGATFGGVYKLDLAATIEHGLATGKITATRNGKRYDQETRLSGTAHGGEADSRADAIFQLKMPQAVESGRDLWVHLDRQNGKIMAAKAFVPEYPEQYDVVLDQGRGDGSAFAGKLTVDFPARTYMTSRLEAVSVTYKLDMKGSPPSSAGTYTCTFGQYEHAKGALRGKVLSVAEIGKTNAVRKGFDWPCWNGPFSAFAAKDAGHDLVDKLSDARLVWMSERTLPGRCQTTRYGPSNLRRYIQRGPGSGGGSPIVADGRVFFHYFKPVPDTCKSMQGYVKSQASKGNHVLPVMFADEAIDVVLCLDAATGRTLWRMEIPGGRYWAMNGRQGSSKGWYTTNPAAGEGHVFVGTSSDVDYCIHADTGKVVWQRRLGPTTGRVVIGGVLVRAEETLRGLDIRTGKTLWSVEGAGSGSALPARWVHEGKEYILVANDAGQLRCVDPANGNVLWMHRDAGRNDLSISARGEYLLCNGSKADKGPGSLACYRVDLKGAKHLWTIDSKTFQYRPKAAPAAIADGHAFVRTRRPEGLAVVELETGKIVAWPKHSLGAAGYVELVDGRALLQPDASHSTTPLLWHDVSRPAQTRTLGSLWPTHHSTTSSYYPILISHPLADGRIFIRGARGIFCYDLRKPLDE